MAARIIIEVECGLVSAIQSEDTGIEVIVVDRDVEGTPVEELDEIGDSLARVREWEVTCPPPAAGLSVFDIIWQRCKDAVAHQIEVCQRGAPAPHPGD